MKQIFILLLIISLYSCGDNPVDNSNPPPSGNVDTIIILEKDSLYGGTIYFTRDSCYDTCTSNVDTLHGSFTLNSENVKTIYAYVNVFNSGIFEVNRTYTQTPPDENFNFTIIVNQSNFGYQAYLQIVEALSPTYRACLKNLKLWHIKRT